MSSEFEQNLEKYAEVILRVGLNLQPGQRLLIGTAPFNYGAPIELVPLIRLITKKAYQMGARFVEVFWDDDHLKLIRFQHAPRNSFEEFPTWRAKAEYEFAKNGDAMLFIVAFNPDLLKDQDSSLFMTTLQTYIEHNKPFSNLRHQDAMNNLVITAPVEGWADKLFSNLPKESRISKLWDIIFNICRVRNQDPISAWEVHIKNLEARCNFLNKKQYNYLKFDALGTDLTIGLPKKHNWQAARSISKNGISFVGNIPTEEVFTLPHKDKTEGFVTLTKPFSRTVLVEDLKLHFVEGKIVKATAKKGQEFINNIIGIDEGTKCLGEVALVPNSSPISQTGILFYNLLIDENASCHIALGNAWRSCLDGGNKMSDEEFSAAGGNISKLHYDFMIGSNEMNIDGILEGGISEPIMRNGEWAFQI
ncbi:MAG: aminopeptidase [Candidatus Thorarchaeota archaeon]